MYEPTNPALLGQVSKDNDAKRTTASGAMTSGALPPLELVPLSLDMAVARRMQKGLDKGYPRGNWMKGLDDPDYIRERMRHFRAHLGWLMTWGQGGRDAAFEAGDNLQDTVDAVAWGAAFMAEASEKHMRIFEMAMTGGSLQEVSSGYSEVEEGPMPPWDFGIGSSAGMYRDATPYDTGNAKHAVYGAELVGSTATDLRPRR